MKSRRGAYSLSRRLISAWLQSHADTHLQAIVFTIFIGLILSSAFSALVVYAQEIEPGRAGRVTGLMFGVNGHTALSGFMACVLSCRCWAVYAG